MFILSEQVQPSTPHNRVPCRWHAGADQTRSCSDQAPLQFTFW